MNRKGRQETSQPHERFRINQSVSKWNTIVIKNNQSGTSNTPCAHLSFSGRSNRRIIHELVIVAVPFPLPTLLPPSNTNTSRQISKDTFSFFCDLHFTTESTECTIYLHVIAPKWVFSFPFNFTPSCFVNIILITLLVTGFYRRKYI